MGLFFCVWDKTYRVNNGLYHLQRRRLHNQTEQIRTDYQFQTAAANCNALYVILYNELLLLCDGVSGHRDHILIELY